MEYDKGAPARESVGLGIWVLRCSSGANDDVERRPYFKGEASIEFFRKKLDLCVSQGSPRSRTDRIFIHTFIVRNWLMKLGGAEKSHHLLSASWRPGEADSVIPVQRPGNQGS